MPIAGNYDIEIGGYKFVFDKTIEDFYSHRLEPLLEANPDISGDPGKREINPRKIRWTMTDWVGGEGNKLWQPNDPFVYNHSTRLNGRIRGQLTGRPARGSVTIGGITDAKDRCFLEVAGGRLWIAGSEELRYSEDSGVTWTNRASGITAGDKVVATSGDDKWLYYAVRHASQREIRRATPATQEAVITRAAAQPWIGLANMNGRLYAWTGKKLHEMDVAETVPLTLNTTYRKVFDTGIDLPISDYGGTAAGSWWGDCVASENSVIFFAGTDGRTTVYEFRDGGAGPIWNLPYGFNGKSLVVQNGVVFVSGQFSAEADADGPGGLYALPLDSRQPLFVGWFRKHLGGNRHMAEMAPSYGSQILISAAIRHQIFIYDAEFDSISLLDDLDLDQTSSNGFKIGDMQTMGKYRNVAVYRRQGVSGPPTQYTNYYFSVDEETERESVGSLSDDLFSGEWDGGYPFENKVLMGVNVSFKPLLADQRITISYAVDGGSFTPLTTITSATPGSADGKVFLPVSSGSSTEKFFRIEFKITLDNNGQTGVKQPVFYGCSADIALLNYTEVLEVVVRLRDEHQKNARGTSRANLAEQVRDMLWTAARNKQVVTVLDGGADASRPAKYDTYHCFIEELDDKLNRAGKAEGSARVKLVVRAT